MDVTEKVNEMVDLVRELQREPISIDNLKLAIEIDRNQALHEIADGLYALAGKAKPKDVAPKAKELGFKVNPQVKLTTTGKK